MKFDHIGILADTLPQGRTTLAACFDICGWTAEFRDEVNGVFVQFGRDSSGICYEIVAPLNEHSPIMGAITARHNILNHVAYLVDDLSTEAKRLRQAKVYPVGPPRPAIAYGEKHIQFFVTPLRSILELIEAPDHRHSFHFQSDFTNATVYAAGEYESGHDIR